MFAQKPHKYMLSTMFPQPSAVLFPAFSCAIAAVLWGFLWYPLRILEKNGVPGLWATLLIYIVALLPIIVPCWRLRQQFLHQKVNYSLLALAAGWTNLAFILAMLEGEVVRVLLLFYLSPIWAMLMAWLILREKIEAPGLVALVLAMTGAVIMLWHPEFFSTAPSLADCYAITAGLAFASTNVLIRRIGHVHWSLKLGSAWIGVVAISVIGLALSIEAAPEFSGMTMWLILLLGFPFMFIMTWTAQYGVTHLPVQISSIIFLLEIIAGAVSAAWLTSEVISDAEYLGGLLIIAAGLIGVIKRQQACASTQYSS